MEKWTKELESGRYRQVTDALKRSRGKKAYGYCCLGVLCDIYVRETGKATWEAVDFDSEQKTFSSEKDKEDSVLPQEVKMWAGMKSDNGQFSTAIQVGPPEERLECESLVVTNDDFKMSFKEISKIIRKNYKGL